MNFHYFSMMYLNDWFYWDKLFVSRITNGEKKERIKGLHDAAKYYKVTRNFKKINEVERFSHALKELEAISHPKDKAEAIQAVEKLSESLKNIYGKNVISAASKFLWIKFKSPVIIYDSRAYAYLKKQGYKLSEGNYDAYYTAWMCEFSKAEMKIKDSCAGLYKVKVYSQANLCKDDAIVACTSEKWFHERVFDKYLWFNG